MITLTAHSITNALASFATGLPHDALWMPPIILLLLGAAAVVDARTGHVPDPLILVGFFIVMVVDGLYQDWSFAALRLAMGFGVAIGLATVNHLWYKFFHHDAIGLGDAKWTALSVAAFHLLPTAIAWIVASWIGVFWLAGAGLLRKKIDHVHFAPFLFIGLLIGLYWTHLR